MTLKYATTTLLLLGLVAAYALVWAEWRFFSKKTRTGKNGAALFLPAILLSPLVIALGFRFFGWNIIFPPALLATKTEWFLHALIPAAILFFASGLWTGISTEIAAWQALARAKPFYRTRLAFGLDPDKALRRLVLGGALTRAWQRALPWVFSELIVLECLFNAPGLGWDIWQRAKERRLEDLTEAIVILLIIYGVCHFAAQRFSQRLGKRLEGYV